MQGRSDPSFLLTKKNPAPAGDEDGRMSPEVRHSPKSGGGYVVGLDVDAGMVADRRQVEWHSGFHPVMSPLTQSNRTGTWSWVPCQVMRADRLRGDMAQEVELSSGSRRVAGSIPPWACRSVPEQDT